MNNSVKKLLYICTVALIDIFVVIGIVCLTLNLYNTVLKSRDDVQSGVFGYRPVVVISGSMLPSIQINSLNLVKICGVDEISEGDVVMYKATNGMLITHRVKEIKDENGSIHLITKGDNNDDVDPWMVDAEQVRGKIVYTCNAIAPFLTDILPSNGTVNAVAMLRAIAIIVIVVSVISILLQYTLALIRAAYWVSIGNDKFKRAMDEYSSDISRASKLDLGKNLYTVPETASIPERLLVGIRRLYAYHSLKLVSKSVDIISRYSVDKKDVP